MRIRQRDLPVVFFYILYVISYLVLLCLFDMGSPKSQFRYYILACAVMISVVYVIQRNKRKNLYCYELLWVIPLSIVLLISSMFQAHSEQQMMLFRSYVQTSLVLLPALYAFCLVNTLKMRTLIYLMQFTLAVTILAYFFEGGHGLVDFFNIGNWIKVSFSKSESFTESSLCAEIFLQLFIFFNFFVDIKEGGINRKHLKICHILSLIFTMLCFKRLGVLFAISILVINKFVNLEGEVSKRFAFVLSILFTVMTYYYTKFMKGEIFVGFDVYNFTTGRDYILSLWKRQGYKSYGYGSSMILIGRYLEMDLIQIYLELNLVVLFMFCYVFFRTARKSIYSFAIMTYSFFNMLTASSLPASLGWIIQFVTIASISSNKYILENIYIKDKKSFFKKLFKKDVKVCTSKHI